VGDEEDGALAHAAAERNLMFLTWRDQGVSSYVSAECLAVGPGSRWYLALESKVPSGPSRSVRELAVRAHPRGVMCFMLSLKNSSRSCDLKNFFFSFPLLLLVRFAPSTVRVSVCVLLSLTGLSSESSTSVRPRKVVLPGLIGLQRPRCTVTRSYVVGKSYSLFVLV
jgi:hypothetical protein